MDTASPAASGASSDFLRHAGVKIILALFLLASMLGVLAWVRLDESEKHLVAVMEEMKGKGAVLTPMQCVDATLEWYKGCSAMKSLCDASVARMMEACLAAADRSAYCAEMGDKTRDRKFGFAECLDRKMTRRNKKACGETFVAIDGHCRALRQKGNPG
ncbi:MAG: hypothetical protein GMKNLPBB_01699 [Myxococcota bacterium]|nr:hypothetical protein [Myxococcota bacterium]